MELLSMETLTRAFMVLMVIGNQDGKWVMADEFWQEYFDELRESGA